MAEKPILDASGTTGSYRWTICALIFFAILAVPIIFAQNDDVSLWEAIVLISLAAASHQAWSANIFTTVSDLFPKKAVSSVTDIGGMAGTLGGNFYSIFCRLHFRFIQNFQAY